MALTVISLHHWFFLVWYLVLLYFCSSVRHLLLFCYYHYITYNVLQLNISPYQLSYVTNSGEGEGLLFYGSTIIPFKDKFDKTLKLYSLMTTKPEEVEARKQKEMEE
mgnify:CR=1 FL=1